MTLVLDGWKRYFTAQESQSVTGREWSMSNVRRTTISVLYKQKLIDRPLNPHCFISAITVHCLHSAVKPVLKRLSMQLSMIPNGWKRYFTVHESQSVTGREWSMSNVRRKTISVLYKQQL